MIKCLFISLAITGTIVGVGFASGREVVSFFTRFGFWSIAFCFIAGIMFGLFCYLIMRLGDEGQGNHKSKADKIFNFILVVCQIAISSAMFAGLGSIFSSLSPMMSYLIRLLAFGLCYLLLLKKNNSVYMLNTILSSIVLVSVLAILLFGLIKGTKNNLSEGYSSKLLIFPMLYVGMNIFTAYPLIEDVGKKLPCKRQKIVSCVLIGFFVSLCLVVVSLSILLFGKDASSQDFVMVEIARVVSNKFRIFYIVIVVMAIVTTLMSTTYGAVEIIGRERNLSLFVCLTLSFVLSFVGFSIIVDKVYSLLGLVCLIVIISRVSTKRLNCRKTANNKGESQSKKRKIAINKP